MLDVPTGENKTQDACRTPATVENGTLYVWI